MKKKISKLLGILFLTTLTGFIICGCSIDDLKRKEYVEVKGEGYSQVDKKDEEFNEIAEAGDIGKEQNENNDQNTQVENDILYSIDGPLETINYKIPQDFYDSTNSTKKILTVDGNIDTDMKKTWTHKSYCSSDGTIKMYVYCVPSEDFGDNLLSIATFSNSADKKVHSSLGTYSTSTDIQYGDTKNFSYSYQIYNGEVKEKSGLVSQVSYSRAGTNVNAQTILVCFYVTKNADALNMEDYISNFFVSIENNN